MSFFPAPSGRQMSLIWFNIFICHIQKRLFYIANTISWCHWSVPKVPMPYKYLWLPPISSTPLLPAHIMPPPPTLSIPTLFDQIFVASGCLPIWSTTTHWARYKISDSGLISRVIFILGFGRKKLPFPHPCIDIQRYYSFFVQNYGFTLCNMVSSFRRVQLQIAQDLETNGVM